MKRNLLFLALFVAAFCFTGTAIAQDAGNPDTLCLETYGNVGVVGAGPYFFTAPLFVTNDIVTAATDSIAGFVIPLCYHANDFGVVNYCSLSLYWNSTGIIATAPDAVNNRTIFRHLPNMQAPVIRNRMMDLNADYFSGWDFIFLELGDQEAHQDSAHFWLSMVPTGSMDQRWWEASHVLLATMTFKMSFEDSLDVCIDSCFWPPSSRLAYSNSNAETYIPVLTWSPDEFCFRPYVIPNQPPVFDTCPTVATIYTNGSKNTPNFAVHDPDLDGTVQSVTATFLAGATGVGGPVVHASTGTNSVTGYVSFDVIDHCLAGGTLEIIATDNGGGKDTCLVAITLGNHAPTVTCPANASFKYCAGYAGNAVGSDADGDNISYGISGVPGIGINASGHITWAPGCNDVGGPYTVTVTVTDVCQATGQCTFTLTVTNAAPTIACPEDGDVLLSNTFVSGNFVANDDCPPYNVSVAVTGTPVGATYMYDPTIVGTQVTWETDATDTPGIYTLTLTVEDGCGLTATCDFDVELIASIYPENYVGIQEVSCVNPGDYVTLDVFLANTTFEFGGFELQIEFDYTSMTFVKAVPGKLLTDLTETVEGPGYTDYLSWEYFNYRLLPCPLCACCKYKILILGLHDMPNGLHNIGQCVEPVLGDKQLVELHFVVNNNENLRGLTIPVCFEWDGPSFVGGEWVDQDCGQNTFSSCNGDYLYGDILDCRFMPEACDDPNPNIVKNLTFQSAFCGQNCGGITICPRDNGFCKRGDVNENSVTYETGDAVLFASYFVEGTVVFRYDVDYQICATDVNADGRTLTLSDLVYLIRVILQDAVAIPKLAPSSEVASLIVTDGVVTAECASQIGGLLFEFDGAVTPTLLAGNMEMMANGNKVLVWSRTGQTVQNAEVVSYTGAQLVSVQAVDRDSRTLETVITARMTPTAFALHAAYPNPFNPNTNLSFSLPEAASYALRIYNVAGQLVRSYEGMGSQGLNVITWDGKDNSGSEVSSGVYFYKLTAAGNSATEKMVMMK